ncbi:MAG: TolC family protein [Pseudohongiellaceae bacterium]|nr:TolC family protein [Pseudohongiellaceae bacterium]
MNMKCLVIAVCSAVIGSASNAQDMATSTISLRNALNATIEAHPSLRSFPLRNEALQGARETADLRPAYTLGVEVENAFGTGAIRDFAGAETSLRLSNVIELGGKRAARVGVVSRKIEALDAEQRVVELDLLVEVVRRFIDVATTQEQVKLQSQYTAMAEQAINIIQPLVAAGHTPQLELDRANAALLQARIAEQAATARLESAGIRLANMWANNTPKFDAVESDFLSVGQVGSIDSILSELSENPDIEYFAAKARLLETQLQLAQTRQQGDVLWSAGIQHLKEFDATGLAFSVTVPLSTKARASGSMRTARANLQEIEARRVTAFNAIEGEIRSLHQSLRQAIAEVNALQQQIIPVLQKVLQQTQEAYAVGGYSYVELISARQEFLDARLSLISSASNAHKIRAEIERLSGSPLSGQ